MSRSREAMCLVPGPKRERLRERFEASFIPEPNTGCWLWEGALGKRGYPKIKAFGRPLGAHRVALLLQGTTLPPGVHAAHRCHNRVCVNPDHIRPLSASDNSRENGGRDLGRIHGWGKDRLGVANWRAKLSEAQVREVRFLLSAGASQASVARKFGVGRTTVRNIGTRQTWAHLDEGNPR